MSHPAQRVRDRRRAAAKLTDQFAGGPTPVAIALHQQQEFKRIDRSNMLADETDDLFFTHGGSLNSVGRRLKCGGGEKSGRDDPGSVTDG